MITNMTPMAIPVPPAPILEQAVGYQNSREARYLALWWEPAGDEAMVSDGFVTFTGHWAGYLAFVHHKAVYPYLASYNLGSSDDPAEYHLVIDLLERKAYIAKCSEADLILASQWRQEVAQIEPNLLSPEDFDALLQGFVEQRQSLPTKDELRNRMEEERKAVAELLQWFEEHIK